MIVGLMVGAFQGKCFFKHLKGQSIYFLLSFCACVGVLGKLCIFVWLLLPLCLDSFVWLAVLLELLDGLALRIQSHQAATGVAPCRCTSEQRHRTSEQPEEESPFLHGKCCHESTRRLLCLKSIETHGRSTSGILMNSVGLLIKQS